MEWMHSGGYRPIKITLQRLLDQSQAGPHIGENATYPPILGLFGPICVPYLKGLNCLFDPPVKSLFCPIIAPPNEFLTPNPPTRNPLSCLFEGGGGSKTSQKMTPPPFWGVEIVNLLVVFFSSIFSCKSVSGFRLRRVRMERSGTSAWAVYAVCSRFCCAGVFGDLSDPVVPTLRRASGDVVTAYASFL